MRAPCIKLLHAAYGRFALGAFNVSNLEQFHGLSRGAARAQAPMIVQFTRIMRDYAHSLTLEQPVRGAESLYPRVPFAAHLDHGDEPACRQAVESGFYGSVIEAAEFLFASEASRN